jgi:hypothetical protein
MIEEKQAIQLFWEEWKYRHDLFWRLLFRWAGAVITLWIIPFVKPEVFKPFPRTALLFPVVALFVTIFSAWVLWSEQIRFDAINKKFKEMRQPYSPPTISGTLGARSVGKSLVLLYAISFVGLTGVVFVLLLRVPQEITPCMNKAVCQAKTRAHAPPFGARSW